MEKVKVIEIKQSVFAANERDADELRKLLKEKGVFLLNIMSSPGSGKTTTLVSLLNILKKKYRIAVMEADIDSDVDAIKIKEQVGIESIQLHTGGMCHLDALMTRQGLENLDLDNLDLVILENVGNLVCPAEFDTGAIKSITILSVPEGDDKPLKYPLMYTVTDAVIINKIDVAPYFNFDLKKCEEYIHMRNKNSVILSISALTGQGVDALADYLSKEIDEFKKK